MNYYHELKIGDVTIPNNLILGPMAGVSDLPFRLLCHEQGAGLVCMEMVSAKAITYRNKKTDALMEIHEGEHPVSLQLFGSEPSVIAEAIRIINSKGVPYDILDINMGCPVPKVVSNGEGSALMKRPELIEEIVRAAVEAERESVESSDQGAVAGGRKVPPVTVKIRKGFTDKTVNAVECALAAQEGGAAAVAVHGRTREQYYSGQADWSIIRQVKEAVTVPVIGNGDVSDTDTARRMIDETGCDGIMIARAAQGNPWIFREVAAGLQGQDIPERPASHEVYDMIMRHADLQLQYKGEYIGIREMRKHVSWYTAGYPNSARLRGSINAMEDMESLREACKNVFLK